MQGKPKQAIEVYKKALAINNHNAEAHFNIASAFNDIGDVE